MRSRSPGGLKSTAMVVQQVVRGICCALPCLMMACGQEPEPGSAGETRAIGEDAIQILSGEGPDESVLGSIDFLAWGPDRQILAFDAMSRRIEVYGPDGWEGSLGGPGAGPGEFSAMVQGMVALQEGVTILDTGNGRISLIGYDGRLLSEHPFDMIEDGLPIHAAASGSNQLLVQLRRIEAYEADSIWVQWPPDQRGAVAGLASGSSVTLPGGGAPVYEIFAEEVYWSPGRTDLYFVNSHDYTIRRQNADTAQVVFDVPHEPRSLSSADTAVVREAFIADLRGVGVPEQQLPSFLSRFGFGEALPVVSGIMVSDEHVWIARGGSPAEIAQEAGVSEMRLILGSRTWDRWEKGGELVETIQFPSRFAPVEISEDAVLGIYYDEFGRGQVAVAPL